MLARPVTRKGVVPNTGNTVWEYIAGQVPSGLKVPSRYPGLKVLSGYPTPFETIIDLFAFIET